MLPSKTYYTMDCALYESNFDTSGTVKPHRIMEFLQDAAGEHANNLGFGWDSLDSTGCLWVLSKIKIRFHKPVTKDIGRFTLYTWPLKPDRFFADRCFIALDGDGDRLFSAASVWLVIDRDTRRIVSADRLNSIYNCDFDDTRCDVDFDFARISRDDGYSFGYDKTVRRSDMDINGHVNNTHYINYAVDVLDTGDRIREAEIVYRKELTLGDTVHIFYKRRDKEVLVVGERDEVCFTVRLALM